AKSWLQECISSHKSRCGKSATRATSMSLIDCTTKTNVEADTSSRWIALSYVWGDRLQTTMPAAETNLYVGARLPSTLPRTVEDAIVVTRQLGYRFLWVDEYCIDQQNKHKQHIQISQMDEVYRGADLTIVAATGEGKNHGLPGVNKTRRRRLNVVRLKDVTLLANSQSAPSHIWDARWFTRAWTLQEGLLSRRVLLFTNHQAAYYC
ncbi:heterokaryon incompatibility protein-domain-containing protein, partial [Phaeosphaeria sp. MPI-PUGE-AT-0046c]